tara:strand:+ start:1401 stop:1670 length:270 start_codon:yes stop_codon:yes gene_type:complete
MARLSTIKEQKKKKKGGQGNKGRTSKKNIKSIKDVKKAELDDDLYESKDGTLRQKFDDEGHMSEEWRRILMGEDFRVKRNVKGTSKRKT